VEDVHADDTGKPLLSFFASRRAFLKLITEEAEPGEEQD
jgi:hypothetical protein